MPEKMKLKLVSPAGSPAAVYSWPLQISDTHNEAVEIVDTIRWVCKDFPDLQLAVDNNILNDYNPTDYESMKQLCDKYNKAITNIRKLWSGREPPPCINSPPSLPLLKHIMNQVYNHAIANPEDLNQYEPFSPEVYGETTFELVDYIIREVKLGEDDVFVDLGSGVGNVILQVASSVNCKECIGIEKAEIPSGYAQEMEKQFLKWTAWYGKSYGDFELLKGDFLSDEFSAIINRATVIFANNYVFGPTVNHQLKLKFANLPDNCRIVSSREFCPLNFRITDRNLDDIGSMLTVQKLSLPTAANCVSWTNKPINFYLHVVDRSKLEDYFRRQKYPEEYPSSSSMSAQEGDEDDDMSDNPQERSYKTSITTDDTSDEDFDAGHYSTPQGRKELELNRLSIHQKHQAQLARQRKLHPHALKRTFNIGLQKSRSVVESAKRQQKRAAKARAVQHSPRRLKARCLAGLNDTLDQFREQMVSYLSNLSQPQHTEALQKSIEKEELRNKYLHMVMNNLDSEVKELSASTVDTMKQCMAKLGMTEFTPAGLLEGAKAIVTHNRELRNNVQQLEHSVNQLQIQQESLQKQSCDENDKRSEKGTPNDRTRSLILSPNADMDTSCHSNELLLEAGSRDLSPTSSGSKDLDILTSPTSSILSPPILSPSRGRARAKHPGASNNSKKDLEIAEILSMLGSQSTKLEITPTQRMDMERPKMYSDLESFSVSIESTEQEMRHCVASLPEERTATPLPTVSLSMKPSSPIVIPHQDNSCNTAVPTTSTTLSIASIHFMLPQWSTDSIATSSLHHQHKTDKTQTTSVSEASIVHPQPSSLFAPHVFSYNTSKESAAAVVLPSRSSVVTTSPPSALPSTIAAPMYPNILSNTQYPTGVRLPTTTTSNIIPPPFSTSLSKLIVGGTSVMSSEETSRTNTTSSYMPINTVLPFPLLSAALPPSSVVSDSAAASNRFVIPSSSSTTTSSAPQLFGATQSPYIIAMRPQGLLDDERLYLQRRKKRSRNSSDAGSTSSLDLPQVNNNGDTFVDTSRSRMDTSTPHIVPNMLPPFGSVSSMAHVTATTNVTPSQPDITKAPVLTAYPNFQPGLLPPQMFGRPMMPVNWLDTRLNPTGSLRPPIYPSFNNPLIGFDPTGTLFKPQAQFTPTLLPSFLPSVSAFTSVDTSPIQQSALRTLTASNPATPTSTLSPTLHPPTSLPIISRDSPLLHSSFTNLYSPRSSVNPLRRTATPPMITTAAEMSPNRPGLWPFQGMTQMSPMLGFGPQLMPGGKFGSNTGGSQSPLLGVHHPGSQGCSPLLISQLGALVNSDGTSKKDNNSGSHSVPETKKRDSSKKHHHHHQQQQLLQQPIVIPSEKPGVIAFAGQKSNSNNTNNGSCSSGSSSKNILPVSQSDCYVVVHSPGTAITTNPSNSTTLVISSVSSGVTEQHHSPVRVATSLPSGVGSPAVPPFSSLVSKMMVKKPRGRKPKANASQEKKDSPSKSKGAGRGRKKQQQPVTTPITSIITPSVVETLAGTGLLDVIAPSGLGIADLPGNKSDTQPVEPVALQAMPVVSSAHPSTQPATYKATESVDKQSPTAGNTVLPHVMPVIPRNPSPAKLDSACSLLSLSESVPIVPVSSMSGSNVAVPAPLGTSDKKNDTTLMGKFRRPSSVAAAEAMLMFTKSGGEKSNQTVAAKEPTVISKETDTSSDDTVIVVEDEPQAVLKGLISEDKMEENSLSDNCDSETTATLSLNTSSDEPKDMSDDVCSKDGVPDIPHDESTQSTCDDQETTSTADLTTDVASDMTQSFASLADDSEFVTNETNTESSTVGSTTDDIHGGMPGDAVTSVSIDAPDDKPGGVPTETHKGIHFGTCSSISGDENAGKPVDTHSVITDDAHSTIPDHTIETISSETNKDVPNGIPSDVLPTAGHNDNSGDITVHNGKPDVTHSDVTGDTDTRNDTMVNLHNGTSTITSDKTHTNKPNALSDISNGVVSHPTSNGVMADNQLPLSDMEICGDELTVVAEQSVVTEQPPEDINRELTEGANPVNGPGNDDHDDAKWEEVSDDELLDVDLTPPATKKQKFDNNTQPSSKPMLTIELPPEDSRTDVLGSDASTPLMDDHVSGVRRMSVSGCIGFYDEAIMDGDAFETPMVVNSMQTINGGMAPGQNGVDSVATAVLAPQQFVASKTDVLSRVKPVNGKVVARQKHRAHSVDSQDSSHGRDSKRDSGKSRGNLELPDIQQERDRSTSPKRKPQPDSTTSPKEHDMEFKLSREPVHSFDNRQEWGARQYKNQGRGRGYRKPPYYQRNYYDRRQDGNQYQGGRQWNNTYHKQNYGGQQYSHWPGNQQQQGHDNRFDQQDNRRGGGGRGNFRRHNPHFRQDNRNNRNTNREQQWSNNRDYHPRKQQENYDTSGGGYRASVRTSQEAGTVEAHYGRTTSSHHYSTHPAMPNSKPTGGSYETISDEEPSTTAGHKHPVVLPNTEPPSVSEDSHSAAGSGSDSELDSNHSSASRPVSRASSVKSSSGRSNQERLFTRRETPSQQQRHHHTYHHNKHNSSNTGYNRRH